MTEILDHAGLIEALGGGAKVEEALSALPDPPKAVTIRAWTARNRIPPEYWPGIIAFAETLGRTVTAEWLMETTPPRKRVDAAPEAAAA